MKRRKPARTAHAHPAELLSQLDHIRTQLELTATAAEGAAEELEALAADGAPDVAHVLRTAVVCVLHRQLDELAAILSPKGADDRTQATGRAFGSTGHA